MNQCKPRSAEATLEAVALVDPAVNPDFQRRDITGDHVDETFCNWFIHMVTALLGCAVPKILARLQLAWLRGDEGLAHGWRKVGPVRAVESANAGKVVVVGWTNPNQARSSHVALVIPTPKGGTGVHIAQAGASNFNSGRLYDGFRSLAPLEFFEHD